MPELSDLRALLRDRQVKEGALGTWETSLCLDSSLVEELAALESEREALVGDAPRPDPTWMSLAGPTPGSEVDTSEIDTRIEAKRQQIRAASVRVVFKALSSVRYQEIINNHPDFGQNAGDETIFAAFAGEVAEKCYYQCWSEDEKVDLPWAELREALTYGEYGPIMLQVLALNKRKVDVPFSLKPSRNGR